MYVNVTHILNGDYHTRSLGGGGGRGQGGRRRGGEGAG